MSAVSAEGSKARLADEAVDREVRVDVVAGGGQRGNLEEVDGAVLQAGDRKLLTRVEEGAERRTCRVVLFRQG